MRSLFSLIMCLVFLNAAAFAQAPAGYQEIYSAPTKVNLGGRPVIAEIAFHADMAAAKQNDLRLALVTDVTKFVVETEQDLENWIAARDADCGERWSSGEPDISFPQTAIRFQLYLEIEYWACGWNGKGTPGRLALETGSVDVTLIPYIEDGKLQARLGNFSLDDRSGISKYLPLEFVVRRALEQELAKLNKNQKFYRAPQPLFDEGFAYESISAVEGGDGRIVITAKYAAKRSAAAFDRIKRKLRTDGITQ
ncbi:hypothetical protein [Hyphococcus sp.]|uniref:hypothetical protein n=1 Tax=Hyphococcus sp. TaxID=2038636 RepID=UPI00208012F8|nr:MAG: hypothetical protein DHS20C04_19990 [Marinicaulis sp.]